MEGTVRCRTCDAPASRIDGVTAFCERCADRTPLRCPRCRGALAASQAGPFVCACGRSWSVDGGRLIESELPLAPASATGAEEKRQRDSSLSIRETPATRAAGYRDAKQAGTLEIRQSEKVRVVVPNITDDDAMAMVLTGVGGAIGVGIGILSGIKFFLMLGAIGLLLAVGVGLGLWWERRGAVLDASRVGTSGRSKRSRFEEQMHAIRLGPEKVEVEVGSRWRPLVPTAEVRSVTREPRSSGRVRVALEVSDSAPRTLFDDVSEQDADEIEARLRQHLARLRAG